MVHEPRRGRRAPRRHALQRTHKRNEKQAGQMDRQPSTARVDEGEGCQKVRSFGCRSVTPAEVHEVQDRPEEKREGSAQQAFLQPSPCAPGHSGLHRGRKASYGSREKEDEHSCRNASQNRTSRLCLRKSRSACKAARRQDVHDQAEYYTTMPALKEASTMRVRPARPPTAPS